MESRLGLIAEFLSRMAVFDALTRADVHDMASRAAILDCPRGKVIFRQGNPCLGMHLVWHGQVKLALETERGGETVLELLGSGSSCGEASVFLGRPHLATAEALCDSTVLRVPGELLREEVRRNAGFSERIIGHLCHRLYQNTLDFGSHVSMSGTQRVVNYLVSERPSGSGDSVTLALRAKKGLIASRLNLTPAHFSRILGTLSGAGLIDVQGRDVHIRDIRRLQAYAAE